MTSSSYTGDPRGRALARWVDETFPEIIIPDYERRAREFDNAAKVLMDAGDDKIAHMLLDAAKRLREDKR